MKKTIWNTFRVLVVLFGIFSTLYFIGLITDLNILPSKYYFSIMGILGLINILAIAGILSKKLILRIISLIIYIVVIVLTIIGIKYGNETLDFLNKAFNNNSMEVNVYNVIVLKSSKYNDIEDLNDKTMGYLSIDDKKSKYMAVVKTKISVEFMSYDDIYELYEDLLSKKIDSIVIDESYVDLLEDDYEDLLDKVKIIYSFEIESITDKKKEVVELKPINILISGSDSRSGKIVSKTRSDVNMIMTINPYTHKILLTSIPRDYYVQLHGTTGNKDKLTHAGIYGVNMSKETIEDLFDIEIDYTIKVGFNSVIEVVDLIGGIDVESDITFNSYHIKGWTVQKGMNHFDGKQALAYSRERYAYKEGDVHRVQNQQQVLEAIITKVATDKKLLKKYDKLLDSFSELYRTDIPDSYIKLIVKEQLANNKSWKVERQYVTGKDAMKETYSMPGRKLYVMIPDNDVVKAATEKINKVLNEE